MEALYKEYEQKLPPSIIAEVKENVPDKITKAKLQKILEKVFEEYKTSLADPGESVGLLCNFGCL